MICDSYTNEDSRMAMQLIRLLRRICPAFLRPRIRRLLFQWLDLRWTLTSGVRLRVTGYGDWLTYNEIFVRGEYDQALCLALDARPEPTAPVHIVDLGSNVGFFTLRAVDALRQRQLGS